MGSGDAIGDRSEMIFQRVVKILKVSVELQLVCPLFAAATV